MTGRDGDREAVRRFQTGNLEGIRRLLDDALVFDNPAPPNALNDDDTLKYKEACDP